MGKQTPEGKVKKDIDGLLKQYQCYSIKPATGGYGVSGALDYACSLKHIGFWVEAKAKNGKVSALQHHQIVQIFASDGIPVVVGPEDIEDFEGLLRMIEQHAYHGNHSMHIQLIRNTARGMCERWGVEFPDDMSGTETINVGQ